MKLWAVEHFSSKCDSPVMKQFERHSLNSKNVSNVLITGESNFVEKSVQLPRVTSYKIHTLVEKDLELFSPSFFTQKCWFQDLRF
jgi:hypothetical protein